MRRWTTRWTTRRWTSALLGASATLMALGSWTVSSVGADDEQEAAEPQLLPPSAFLTGAQAARSAQLEGVEIDVRPTEGGYELTFFNPSADDRALRWQLDCSELRGSPISRMGPIPVRVHEELLEVRVPARGRATHVVRVAHPAAPSEPMLGFGAFASMRLLLTPVGSDTAAPAFASLVVPASPAPASNALEQPADDA